MASEEATLRTNEFKFLLHGVSDFHFSIKESTVTKGQPFEGISTTVSDVEGASLYVEAGRHRSSETAKWFKAVIKTGATIGCNTGARGAQLCLQREHVLHF